MLAAAGVSVAAGLAVSPPELAEDPFVTWVADAIRNQRVPTDSLVRIAHRLWSWDPEGLSIRSDDQHFQIEVASPDQEAKAFLDGILEMAARHVLAEVTHAVGCLS
jgi:hypothetical protein